MSRRSGFCLLHSATWTTNVVLSLHYRRKSYKKRDSPCRWCFRLPVEKTENKMLFPSSEDRKTHRRSVQSLRNFFSVFKNTVSILTALQVKIYSVWAFGETNLHRMVKVAEKTFMFSVFNFPEIWQKINRLRCSLQETLSFDICFLHRHILISELTGEAAAASSCHQRDEAENRTRTKRWYSTKHCRRR